MSAATFTESSGRDVEPSLAELGLRSAFLSLRSQITYCKLIDRADYLEVAPFAIRPGMQVGVAPMGFADGLAFLNCGAALVRGRRAPDSRQPLA